MHPLTDHYTDRQTMYCYSEQDLTWLAYTGSFCQIDLRARVSIHYSFSCSIQRAICGCTAVRGSQCSRIDAVKMCAWIFFTDFLWLGIIANGCGC